jgi:hypothetical protein
MEGKARGHAQLHRKVKPESKRAWLVSRTHDNEESGQGGGGGGGVHETCGVHVACAHVARACMWRTCMHVARAHVAHVCMWRTSVQVACVCMRRMHSRGVRVGEGGSCDTRCWL